MSWERSNEISLHCKEAFYSNLNMEDEDEEKSFLQYNDDNNLYGFAMLEPLPVDGFEWM